MKISPAKFKDFLKEVSFNTKSILIFGPDPALLAFKRVQILEALGQKQLFQSISLDEGADMEEILSRQAQPSLFMAEEPPATVYTLSNAKDKILKDLESVLQRLGKGALLLLLGEGLPTSSKLVKYHEKEDGCFCLGVYDQTFAERQAYIKELAQARHLHIDTPEVAYLATILPSDPQILNQTFEKLSLFMGQQSIVTGEILKNVIDTDLPEDVDKLIEALCLGQKEAILSIYKGLKLDGQEDIMLLRAVTNHLLRLFQVTRQIKSGISQTTALETLRPPLFFKTKDRFLAHLNKWTPERLSKAIRILKEMEMWIKTGQGSMESYLSRGFLKIAALVCP